MMIYQACQLLLADQGVEGWNLWQRTRLERANRFTSAFKVYGTFAAQLHHYLQVHRQLRNLVLWASFYWVWWAGLRCIILCREKNQFDLQNGNSNWFLLSYNLIEFLCLLLWCCSLYYLHKNIRRENRAQSLECSWRKLYKHYYSQLILGLNNNHDDHYDYDYDDFDVTNYSIGINHGWIMIWITYMLQLMY